MAFLFLVAMQTLFENLEGNLVNRGAINLEIAAIPTERTEIHCEGSAAKGHFAVSAVLTINRIIGVLESYRGSIHCPFRNPIVNDVHNPADSAATVKERRWSAYHLQALCFAHLNRVCVIR